MGMGTAYQRNIVHTREFQVAHIGCGSSNQARVFPAAHVCPDERGRGHSAAFLLLNVTGLCVSYRMLRRVCNQAVSLARFIR
jgi:hypothetical protein